MKAAQITQYGGAEVVRIVSDAPEPDITANQVLVMVHATAINPFDGKLQSGIMKDFIPLKLPAILGSDMAGTVLKVGDDVRGFRVGQEVYGMANGTGGQGSFAEQVPVAADQLAAKPQSVDFVTAAALPLAAVSAYQVIVEHMDVQPGQKILIHGAAGGIGSLAIQIAKDRGAYVAATASASDAEFVKNLGADEAIDYKSQNFAELVHDYDAVFDTVGGQTNVDSYKALKSGGLLVSMVDDTIDALVEQYKVRYVHQSSRATTALLQAVAKLVDAGKLSVHIDKIFPLDQTGEALEHLKTGHPRGKVVIQVADSN